MTPWLQAASRLVVAVCLSVVCVSCMGGPKATGRGTYIVKRPGTFSRPSRQVAANAASDFCSERDQAMQPVRESPDTGPWGEPLTELTFRCVPAAPAD